MALVHVVAVRNLLAGVIETVMANGTAGAPTIVIRDGSDEIVIFELDNTPFGSATAGVITAANTPIAAVAVDSGAAVDNFIAKDRDGATVLSGSVTAVGMGGDIEVTNVNIALGQDCSLESLTYEAAA